jgi:hypothetical protein
MSMSLVLFHLFFLFAINIVGLQQIILKNMKDGWALGFVGT